MTSDDIAGTPPVSPAVEASDDASLGEAPLDAGNANGTRDELWQVQSDPKAAREVAARHLARLMYRSRENWSHYVFHENDPQP